MCIAHGLCLEDYVPCLFLSSIMFVALRLGSISADGLSLQGLRGCQFKRRQHADTCLRHEAETTIRVTHTAVSDFHFCLPLVGPTRFTIPNSAMASPGVESAVSYEAIYVE